MTNWFLITSAINVEYGIFDNDKRFSQTLATIASIRKYCENSKIVLLEGAPNALTEEQNGILLNTCDIVIDFSQNDLIQFAHRTQDIDTLKHPCELFLLGSFMKQQDFIEDSDRVYKISGRYFLNSNFNSSLHAAAKEKLMFGQKFKSCGYYDVKSGDTMPAITDFQYRTRLYSFCGSLREYMTNKYQEMFDFTLNLYNSGGFSDVEHIMYHHLDKEKVIEIKPIGVSGAFADGKYHDLPDGGTEINE